MTIGKNKVYHIKLNEENTTSKNYLDYLKALNEKLNEESEKKFVIILDNLKLHKTNEVISFCIEKKLI